MIQLLAMLKTKSVRSRQHRSDGLRILVTRFRGRGLPGNAYHVWMASLGPSERLLRRFQGGSLSWGAFSRAYRAELFMPAALDARNKNIKNHGQKFALRLIKHLARAGNVTLLCHCDEDQKHCHRHILSRLICADRT
jgi:uncharacterized protein YeaO (DUF488 family)